MAQTRYDICWHDPADEVSHTDFKQTPKQIVKLLSWGLVGNTDPITIYSISKCAE